MQLAILGSLAFASLVALTRDVDAAVFTNEDLELAKLLDRARARCLKTIDVTSAKTTEPIKAGIKHPETKYVGDLVKLNTEWNWGNLCIIATQFVSSDGKYTVGQITELFKKWNAHFGEPKGIMAAAANAADKTFDFLTKMSPGYVILEMMAELKDFAVVAITPWSGLITQSITHCDKMDMLNDEMAKRQLCTGELMDKGYQRFLKFWLSCVLVTTARSYKTMKYNPETEKEFAHNLMCVVCPELLPVGLVFSGRTCPDKAKRTPEQESAYKLIIGQTNGWKALPNEDADLKQHFTFMYSEAIEAEMS